MIQSFANCDVFHVHQSPPQSIRNPSFTRTRYSLQNPVFFRFLQITLFEYKTQRSIRPQTSTLTQQVHRFRPIVHLQQSSVARITSPQFGHRIHPISLHQTAHKRPTILVRAANRVRLFDYQIVHGAIEFPLSDKPTDRRVPPFHTARHQTRCVSNQPPRQVFVLQLESNSKQTLFALTMLDDGIDDIRRIFRAGNDFNQMLQNR